MIKLFGEGDKIFVKECNHMLEQERSGDSLVGTA